jgi:hypothetical protein
VEHFEDDDDDDNDSDDVEDVSVHGSWITPRYPGGKQFGRRNEKLESESLARRTNFAQLQEEPCYPTGSASSGGIVLTRFGELSCGGAGYVPRIC